MVLRTSATILHDGVVIGPAIRYAVDNGADVIEMSLGSTGTPAVLRNAVSYAEQQGVPVVAAMANESSTHPNSPTFLDPVIGVGAIVPDAMPLADDFLVKGGFANYGPILDVVAPSDITTTKYGGGYSLNGGTSSATPEVAGVAALVISWAQALGLSLGSEEVTQIPRMSAQGPHGASSDEPHTGTSQYRYRAGCDTWTGWGRVDAAAAVAMVTADGSEVPPVADIDSPDWYQNVRGTVAVKGLVSAHAGNGSYSVKLYLGQGTQPSTLTLVKTFIGTTMFGGTLAKLDTSTLAPGRGRSSSGSRTPEGTKARTARRSWSTATHRSAPGSPGRSGAAWSPVRSSPTSPATGSRSSSWPMRAAGCTPSTERGRSSAVGRWSRT